MSTGLATSPGSGPPGADGPTYPGETAPHGAPYRRESDAQPPGRIHIPESVVAKLAAVAAREVPDAGGAATRVFSQTVPGASRLGGRRSSLDTLPKASARVHDQVAFVDVTISVRWPAPIPQVTDAVRGHVAERVAALTGLTVAEVHIAVTDLVTDIPSGPRVR